MPPVNTEFPDVETVQLIPSELYATTHADELSPTATQRDPFQATARHWPELVNIELPEVEDVQVNPS